MKLVNGRFIMPFQWWIIVCYFLVFDLNIKCLNKVWKIRPNVYWSYSYSLHVIKEVSATLSGEKSIAGVLPYVLCPPFTISFGQMKLSIGSATSSFFEEYVFRIVRGKKLVLSPRISCFNIDVFPKSFHIFLLGYFIYLTGPW